MWGKWIFLTAFQTRSIAALSGKPLLAKIIDDLEKAKDPNTILKYKLYCVHDNTIMSLMTTLGVKAVLPGYISDFNFELFKTDTNDYQVKVRFNGKPLAIPGCDGNVCTLAELTKK